MNKTEAGSRSFLIDQMIATLDHGGWVQYVLATDADGVAVYPDMPSARAWSLLGLMYHIRAKYPQHPSYDATVNAIVRALQRRYHPQHIRDIPDKARLKYYANRYNDMTGQIKENVLALLQDAKGVLENAD